MVNMAKVLYTENVDPIGPEMLQKVGIEVVMADRNEEIIKKKC